MNVLEMTVGPKPGEMPTAERRELVKEFLAAVKASLPEEDTKYPFYPYVSIDEWYRGTSYWSKPGGLMVSVRPNNSERPSNFREVTKGLNLAKIKAKILEHVEAAKRREKARRESSKAVSETKKKLRGLADRFNGLFFSYDLDQYSNGALLKVSVVGNSLLSVKFSRTMDIKTLEKVLEALEPVLGESDKAAA